MEHKDPTHQLCAARELWEETGLWVGPRQPSAELRQQWLGGQLDWARLESEYPLRLEQLAPAGVRTTPDYALLRFRAEFFLWLCPPEQEADIWPGELEAGGWWQVDEALEAWRKGEIFLAAPTQDSLLGLAEHSDFAAAAGRLCEYPEDTPDPIRIRPGLAYLPLITPTLPPARHTLCFVLGHDDLLVVDPGPSDPNELQRLERVVGSRRVAAVVLTHHHPDHVGGLGWCREKGWPLWAHRRTGELLGLNLDRELAEGDRIEDWQILHTPGHASGHLALWQSESGILLSGDLVSGISTILVPPPDGDMGEYLDSLQRCRDLQPRLVVPSHGGPFGPGNQLLGQTLQHRLEREARVVAALGQTFAEILAQAYADVSGPPLRLAEISLLAHLQKLEREGRASRQDERWLPA